MIIAVDFDGTLCANEWPAIGAPRKGVIAYLAARKAAGDKLILWTNRRGERLSEAVQWCERQPERGAEHLTYNAEYDNISSTKGCLRGRHIIALAIVVGVGYAAHRITGIKSWLAYALRSGNRPFLFLPENA